MKKMFMILLAAGMLLAQNATGRGTAVEAAGTSSASQNLYGVSGNTITPVVSQNTDISEAVNAALRAAEEMATDTNPITVTVPAGNYYLTKALHIYSNTILSLSNVTLNASGSEGFNMLISGTAGTYKGISNYNASSLCSGYNGFENITVRGGTFVSNDSNLSSIVRIFHATNVTIDGVTLKGGGCTHQMELAAINGLYVRNCTFRDFGKASTDVENEENQEALQLDIPCREDLYPGVYQDGTPMKNVEITGCTFQNVARGLGTHTLLLGAHHENIKINNNTFIDVLEECVVALNYLNCEIKNNTITNCGGGILVQNFKSTPYSMNTTILNGAKAYNGTFKYDVNTEISGNKITITYHPTCKDEEGIKVFGYNQTAAVQGGDGKTIPKGNYYISGVTVKNNTIVTSGTGIHLLNARSCTVSDNTVTGRGFSSSDPEKNEHDGLFIDLGSKNITVKNNKISGMTRNGILLQESGAKSITKNKIADCGNKGINFYNGSECTGSLSNNEISGCKGGILVSTSSKASSIKDNKISGYASGSDQDRGIMVFNKSTVTGAISGNTISKARDTGISVSDSSSVNGGISDNKITSPGRNGIEVIKSGKVKKDIANNTITSAKNIGIVLQTKSSVSAIKSNRIEKCSENGIYLYQSSKSTGAISGNTITNCSAGIMLSGSSSAAGIKKNKIRSCKDTGINLYNKAKSTGAVSGNTITSCGGGVMLSKSSSAKSIESNVISGNSGSSGGSRGIMLYNSSTVSGSIEGNSISNHSDSGIAISGKSKVSGSISSNTVKGAKRNGIELLNSSRVAKDVRENTVTSSKEKGITVSKNSTVGKSISKNTVKGSKGHGISLYSASNNLTITANKVTGGSDHPIVINTGTTRYKITVEENTVQGNGKVQGIRAASGSVSVSDNKISKVKCGVYLEKKVKGDVGANKYGSGMSMELYANGKTCKVTSAVKNVKGNGSASRATVSWKKVSGAAGYEVEYSLRRDFSSGVKTKETGSSAKSLAISGLKKGKTYYIRVRAFQKTGSIKVYGEYGTGSFKTK